MKTTLPLTAWISDRFKLQFIKNFLFFYPVTARDSIHGLVKFLLAFKSTRLQAVSTYSCT